MGSVERGELCAADVMTVFGKYKMCESDHGCVLVRCLVRTLSLTTLNVADSDWEACVVGMLERVAGVMSYCPPTLCSPDRCWVWQAGSGPLPVCRGDVVDPGAWRAVVGLLVSESWIYRGTSHSRIELGHC